MQTDSIENDQTVKGLKPRATRYAVKDSEVTGLELRIRPDGDKTWSLRYRVNGKQQRLGLGKYPRVSLSAARKAANQELRKVDGGIDPVVERAKQREAAERAKGDSIERLCIDYIEFAKPRKDWKADDGILRNRVLPEWHGRAVTSITRRDCAALLDKIALGTGKSPAKALKQGRKRKRGPAPVVANRTAALLSRMFGYAVDKFLIDANIAAKLPKPGVEYADRPEAEKESKPYTEAEICVLWAVTEKLDAKPRAIIRMGLLTGQRPGEVSDLPWAEIDGDNWWTIPGARTKNGRPHRVFLVQEVLDELQRVPRVDDKPFVFEGYRGKKQGSQINRQVFADVRRRKMPRHALRDTFSTGLASIGFSNEEISKVINHVTGQGPAVTRGYVDFEFDALKRKAMLRWAKKLMAIVNGESESKKVVSISGSNAQ